MAHLQRIIPCLWFDNQAEEAANLYTSTFKNSKILKVTRYSGAGQEIHGKPEGSVLTVSFEIDGMPITALNGGPHFKLNEAFSLQIMCEDQAEIDYYWSRLTADGGSEGLCGWLTDRFGLSWQVVPAILQELISDPDPAKATRVTAAYMKMRKFDIEALQRAYAGA